MTSLSIVASPPCGSSSFPAYRGSALVKTMPSGLLPLVFSCFPHPSLENVFRIQMYRFELPRAWPIFLAGEKSRGVCITIYSRCVRVIFKFRQNPKIPHAYTVNTWNLLLLKLGFSTKLHLHCLHLTRLCGLWNHPPLWNSGNVSGHHLAGNNKTGCWSSFVSFVSSFSSVQFCYPCHLSS